MAGQGKESIAVLLGSFFSAEGCGEGNVPGSLHACTFSTALYSYTLPCCCVAWCGWVAVTVVDRCGGLLGLGLV